MYNHRLDKNSILSYIRFKFLCKSVTKNKIGITIDSLEFNGAFILINPNSPTDLSNVPAGTRTTQISLTFIEGERWWLSCN